MSILDDITNAVFEGEENKTVELVKQALDEGQGAPEILDGGLVEGLRRLVQAGHR